MSAPRPRRSDPLLALFAAVLWAAAAFAVDGVLAVALDRDPVEAPVGAFYGILALALSAVALWAVMAASTASRVPWFGVLGAAAAVYLVQLAVATPYGLALVVEQIASPFLLSAVVLAAATTLGCWALARRAELARDAGSDPRMRE
jgi:hypothetical protein